MSDIHVDDFFKDAARILNRLYLSFPRKSAIFVEDIAGAEETDEFGMHSDRFLACFATMLWLADEGYLRFEEQIRQEAIDQAVLTGRCFTLLTLPANRHEPVDVTGLPESVRLAHTSTIHRLREAVKSQSSLKVRKVMMEMMASMAGGGLDRRGNGSRS